MDTPDTHPSTHPEPETCEAYVLSLLRASQQKIASLESSLSASESSAKYYASILALLRDHIAMDPSTGRVYGNFLVPEGTVRDALASIFTKPLIYPSTPHTETPPTPLKDTKKKTKNKDTTSQSVKLSPSILPPGTEFIPDTEDTEDTH